LGGWAFRRPDIVAGEAAMRKGFVVVAALVTLPALPSGLSSQGLRLPHIGRRTAPLPAPLPPEMPLVSRSLAYKRLRWTAEGYSMMSSVRIPLSGVGMTSYSTFGTGTHAAYNYTDHFSATVDMSASFAGSPVVTQAIEVGTRYSPFTWDHSVRPFFDLRGGFLRLYDTYALPAGSPLVTGETPDEAALESFYSRGFGSVGGVGTEFTLTRSLALSTEISATRMSMRTYQRQGPTGLPAGEGYRMTAFRYSLGFKYSPVRTLHLVQNPRS
jgi:hypothetical protein